MERRNGESHILSACRPYLRMLQAYNSANLHQDNWRTNVFYVILTSMLVVLLPTLMISASWYLIEAKADLKHISASLPLILTLIQVEMTLITMIINNRAIAETIDQVQKVINKRCLESVDSAEIYKKVESSHSLFHMYMVQFLVIVDIVLFVPSAMIPISYAIFGYPPPNLWPLPVEINSLLGRASYVGFYVDLLCEWIAVGADIIIVAINVTLYVGIFIYINGMVKDMQTRLFSIKSNSVWASRPMERWFIYEINLHIEIINVAESLGEVMKVVLFNMTFTCVIVISLNLLVVELNESVTVQMVVAFTDLLSVLAVTFSYFLLAEWITTDLLSIADLFYNSNWHQLSSVRQQKRFVLPIQRAQRELRLKGLGLFDCSLAMFASIIRTAGSYYIIVRGFK